MRLPLFSSPHRLMLAAAFLLTAAVYWPGLYGGFLFDDYPNIIDNQGVQPAHASVSSLVGAALSSPSSEFRRPLASLSFAANYLATGLDPYWMKVTNLIFHLANGLLVFFLARILLLSIPARMMAVAELQDFRDPGRQRHIGIAASLVTAGWMLLPINLTAVLYVVQRMESMANLFVLAGLIGYVAGRRKMLMATFAPIAGSGSRARSGFWLCAASLVLPTAIGVLAKETAVMLPFYALLIEWALFRFHKTSVIEIANGQLSQPASTAWSATRKKTLRNIDYRMVILFLLLLALPMVAGLLWVLPNVLQPERWTGRNFNLAMRLLSEARIVLDYVAWTLLPTPHALSFYHDDFNVSTGLLTPWTTLASICSLLALAALALWLRPRQPLIALGIALFLGCQLLTGTVLPLELIYEHRNYFASFGLLLAVVPLLAAPPKYPIEAASVAPKTPPSSVAPGYALPHAFTVETTPAKGPVATLPMVMPRYILLAGLMLCWTALTALTAYAWGNPLRLAEDLAARAPNSPRAEYELGRTYIIYSHYDPSSPFTRLAYAPLERAAALPDGSILPEQALIFMNARMHLPLKDAWWNSLIGKLKAHKPGVQDESSLGALTQCQREHHCELSTKRMTEAYFAALSHPDPDARLLAMYGDYAWNVLNDHELGLRMTVDAVGASPNEPAYQITLIRMLVVQGRKADAKKALQKLGTLNIGGRLNASLNELRALPGAQ